MPDPLWSLSDHVCRECLGRILIRQTGDTTQALCADCGAEAAGDHKSLCACGAKMADGTDAGLRCVINPEFSPSMPQKIAIVHKSRIHA